MKKPRKSSKKSDSDSANQKIDPTVLTAVIGGIVTVVVALITILPQFLEPRQPVEAPPTLAAATMVNPTSTFIPTAILSETGSAPAATVFASPSIAELVPQINCLDQWEIITLEGSPDITPVPQGQCNVTSIPGIVTSDSGLSFIGTNIFKGKVGIYGIAVKVPSTSVVEFTAHLSQLYNAAFWVGLSSSPTPQDNMMILALRPSFQPSANPQGDIDLYINQYGKPDGQYLWDNLSAGTGITDGPPYLYNFRFNINNGKIETQINDLGLESQFVSQPIYLFLGFYKKSNSGSVTLDVNVDNWKVTP